MMGRVGGCGVGVGMRLGEGLHCTVASDVAERAAGVFVTVAVAVPRSCGRSTGQETARTKSIRLLLIGARSEIEYDAEPVDISSAVCTRTNSMPLDPLQRGTLYTLFTPVVRLAYHFGLPLKDLRELLDIAYFEEMRRDRRTFKEIAEVFDVSTRKITQLSQALKGLLLVSDAEQKFGLPRKLELMIWAQPMSDRRLTQVLVLEYSADEIQKALEALVARGAIEWDKKAGVYRPVPLDQRDEPGADDDLLARLDALRNFIDGVTDLVQARFFGKAESSQSFVRTHNFFLMPDDLKYLHDLHGMFRLVRDQLEERARRRRERGEGGRVGLSFVMMWAPRADESKG